MKGPRTPIPEDLAALVLFVHDHTCCVCCDRSRTPQIHHIDENPANSDFANLAVLCLECHNDTQVTGGFGRKLRAPEIRQYREAWIERVTERRKFADRIAALKQAGQSGQLPPAVDISEWQRPPQLALLAYVTVLPNLLQSAYSVARGGWGSVATHDMMEATLAVSDVVERMLVHLASWFPPNHFGEQPAEQYFNALMAFRRHWHLALHEPDGPRSGGREAIIEATFNALADAQEAVVDIVRALASSSDGIEFDSWLARWNAATESDEE